MQALSVQYFVYQSVNYVLVAQVVSYENCVSGVDAKPPFPFWHIPSTNKANVPVLTVYFYGTVLHYSALSIRNHRTI